jgi:hypothetical protein
MSKPKRVYIVGKIITEGETNVGPIKMSMEDGMLGVMPVFSNKKKAEKFAGKGYSVFQACATTSKEK